jgi:hypothetical protein
MMLEEEDYIAAAASATRINLKMVGAGAFFESISPHPLL